MVTVPLAKKSALERNTFAGSPQREHRYRSSYARQYVARILLTVLELAGIAFAISSTRTGKFLFCLSYCQYIVASSIHRLSSVKKRSLSIATPFWLVHDAFASIYREGCIDRIPGVLGLETNSNRPQLLNLLREILIHRNPLFIRLGSEQPGSNIVVSKSWCRLVQFR